VMSFLDIWPGLSQRSLIVGQRAALAWQVKLVGANKVGAVAWYSLHETGSVPIPTSAGGGGLIMSGV